jgi:putative ATPase
MADPYALKMALSGMEAYRFLGTPEGELALAQAAIYLATAPKSNSTYTACANVSKTISETGSLPTPMHIRNAPTRLMDGLGYGRGYEYAHDFKDAVTDQTYLPIGIGNRRFYRPTDRGFENTIQKRLSHWRRLKKECRAARKRNVHCTAKEGKRLR